MERLLVILAPSSSTAFIFVVRTSENGKLAGQQRWHRNRPSDRVFGQGPSARAQPETPSFPLLERFLAEKPDANSYKSPVIPASTTRIESDKAGLREQRGS